MSVPGEIPDDRLEIEQRLEPALRDLGLIRRVRRDQDRILEDVPKNHARRDAPVVAHPDEGPGNDVALGDPPKTPQMHCSLSPRGRSSGDAARMPGGIVWSMSASSDGTPTTRTILVASRRVRSDVS